MKSWKQILLVGVAAGLTMAYAGCTKEKQDPQQTTVTITFEDAPEAVMAGPTSYGENYYSASAAGHQVTTGYFAEVGDGTYVQFPVNYSGSYEFWNGGTAISNFTNLVQGDYKNQMSVYNAGGYAGSKNFAVCTGNNGNLDQDKDGSGCAKIYLTDKVGYRVVDANKGVQGKAKTGQFNSVWVCNTTYAYIAMRDGNLFTQGPLKSKNGWFKVEFYALDANGKVLTDRKVEHYLANFDPAKNEEAGIENTIRDTWNKVDLTPLGDDVAGLLVNFQGSDVGKFGLNTPKYVAIDNLTVTISK